MNWPQIIFLFCIVGYIINDIYVFSKNKNGYILGFVGRSIILALIVWWGGFFK